MAEPSEEAVLRRCQIGFGDAELKTVRGSHRPCSSCRE
jgi:hypothetical protein